MLAKQILHQLLSHLKHGAVTITYWDGQTTTYGQGEPYNHITVKSPQVVWAMLKNMSIGFNEAYMDGQLEIDGPLTGIVRLLADNKHIFTKLGRNQITRRYERNTKRRQAKQIKQHYDVGNDFYKLWLDKSLTYTCAYFHTPTDSLETAQAQKIDHVLRKLQLEPGQRILDIGCGWGSLLLTAAQKYGVSGLGVTLSREQYEYATAAAKKAGLSQQVQFEHLNYQDLGQRNVRFDRVFSVGILEHVGRHNHHIYFATVEKLLKPGGLSVLHTITQERECKVDPWTDKYIFPGGYIPSYREIVRALPRYDFRLQDYENLRLHYVLTLKEWLRRYQAHKAKIISLYDKRFYRMYQLYLAHSAASFEYWDLGLSQFVFTKGLNNHLPLTRQHLYG